MGGGAVEVKIIFLHVLAMVAFAVRKPEKAFLEDGVLAIPEGQGKAEALLVIGNAR
jgi:hypothetical protein